MMKTFKPEDGQAFYYLEIDLLVVHGNYDSSEALHVALAEFGNVFETEEEAAFAAEQIRVRIELQRLADAANEAAIEIGEEDPTLWNYDNNHFYIFFDCNEGKLNVTFEWDQRCDLIYFPSAVSAFVAIEKLGDERILRYYFGIEPESEEGGADE